MQAERSETLMLTKNVGQKGGAKKGKGKERYVADPEEQDVLNLDTRSMELDSTPATPRGPAPSASASKGPWPWETSKRPVFCTGTTAAVVSVFALLIALLVGGLAGAYILYNNQAEALQRLQDQVNRIPAPVVEVIVGVGPPAASLGIDGTIYIDSNLTSGIIYYKTTNGYTLQYGQRLYPSSHYGKRAAPTAPGPQWVVIGAGSLLGGPDLSGLTTNATVQNVGGVSAPRIANSTLFVESLLPTIDPDTQRPRITLGDIVFANGSNTQGVQIQADANAAETLLIGPFPTGSSPTTGATVQIIGAIIGGVTQQFIVDSNGDVHAPTITTTDGFVSNSSGTYMQGGFVSNSSGTYIPNLTTDGGVVSNSSGIYTPSVTTTGGFVSNASGTYIPNLTTAGGLVSNSSGTYIHDTPIGNVTVPTYAGLSGKDNLTVCATDDCLGIRPTVQKTFSNGTLYSPSLASETLYATRIFLNDTDLSLFVTNSSGMAGAPVTARTCVALFGDAQGKSAYCLLNVRINDTGDFYGLNSLQAGSVITTDAYASSVQASIAITAPTVSGTTLVNAGSLSINSSPAITWTSGGNTLNLASNVNTGSFAISANSIQVNGLTNLASDGSVTGTTYVQTAILGLGGRNYTSLTAGNGVGNVTALYSALNAVGKFHRCISGDCANVTGSRTSEDTNGNVVIVGTTTTASLVLNGSSPIVYTGSAFSFPAGVSSTGRLSTSTGLSIGGSADVTYAAGTMAFPMSLSSTGQIAATTGITIGGSSAITYSAGTLSLPMSTSVTGLLSATTGLSLGGSSAITYTATNFTFPGSVVATNVYTAGAVSAGTVTATTSASLQTLSIGGSAAITYTSGTSTINLASNLNTGSSGITTNNIVVNGGTTLGADSSIKNVAYLQTSIINLGGANYTYFGPGVGVGNVSALYSAQNGVNKFTKCAVATCVNVTGTFASEDASGNVVFTGTMTTTGVIIGTSSSITYSASTFSFPASMSSSGTISATTGLSIGGSSSITYSASTFSFPGSVSGTGTLSTDTGIVISGSGAITYATSTFSFPGSISGTGSITAGSTVKANTGLQIGTSSAITYAASLFSFPASITSTGFLKGAGGLIIGTSSVITYTGSAFAFPADVSVTGQVSASTGVSIAGSAAITYSGGNFTVPGNIVTSGTNGVYTNTVMATTSMTTPQVSTTNVDLTTINGITYKVTCDVTFNTPSATVQSYTVPSTTEYLLVTMTGGGGGGFTYGGGGASGIVINYPIFVSNVYTFYYFVGAGSAYGSNVNGTSSNFTYTSNIASTGTTWLLTEGGVYGGNPPGGSGGGVWINGMYLRGGYPGLFGGACNPANSINGSPGETWMGPLGGMAYGGAGGSQSCTGVDGSYPGSCANVVSTTPTTGGVSCLGIRGPGSGGWGNNPGASGGMNGMLRVQCLRVSA